jgi:predicted aspartyl protease
MLKTTRTTCKNFGFRQPSLTPKPMNVGRTLLFVGAIAAAASTQPAPAHAGGNGAAVALGIIGGIIAGAAAANANQPSYSPPPAYADNSAACQSWLAVLNDPRYDTATRAQAQQIVSGCGLPYSGSSGPTPSYANAEPCAAWRATVADRQTYGITAAQDESALASRCGGGPAPVSVAAAPAAGATEVPLLSSGLSHHVSGIINGMATDFTVDTGADVTQITPAFAEQLLRQGRLTQADYRGTHSFRMADGHLSAPQQMVILHSVTIGGRTANNVVATIASPALLGQTFLRHFGSYMIDNRRGVLVLG